MWNTFIIEIRHESSNVVGHELITQCLKNIKTEQLKGHIVISFSILVDSMKQFTDVEDTRSWKSNWNGNVSLWGLEI